MFYFTCDRSFRKTTELPPSPYSKLIASEQRLSTHHLRISDEIAGWLLAVTVLPRGQVIRCLCNFHICLVFCQLGSVCVAMRLVALSL